MSLTDDWKAGKLEDGLYYILLENGKTPIAELETWCRYDDEVEEPYKTSQEFFGYPKDIISEVLSPIPSYNHFADLRKKAEKYDRIKVNGNYPDKISKLKSRIKKLLEEKDHFIELTEKIKTLSSENERLLNLQAVTNKEIEELESDSLAKKEGEEIVAELTNENNNLRSLLKECDGCVRCLRAYGVADCNGSNINDLITRINVTLGNNKTQANTATDIKIHESEE